MLLVVAFSALAQNNVTVKGTVIDETGEPLLGAGVVVKGTTTGTTADFDGNFSLTAPEGSVLQFISVGYETIEITVGPDGNLGTITMKTETTLLDQVVVVGYGSQKKVDLTGSVAIVDADEMKKVSHSNISSMLEGKVAGVQITSDGQPGADPSVRIRGIGSFGDTSPLYVIDGVPMGTTIRDFSPNDIETIQVLKDASAAAIYGSRAANGVVIITTKNGKKNQPVKVDYRGYVGVDQIRKDVYKVMDAAQYGEYMRMSYANSDLADKVPSGYVLGSENYLDPKVVNTDWFKEMFKTGIRHNHNLNISGGGENSTYNIGLDYFSQKGTLRGAGPNFDRFTIRVNNTMDIKFLKIRTGIVYSHSDQDNMSASNANEYVQGLYGTQYPIMATALFMPPSIKAYDATTWFLDRVVGAASDYSYDAYGFGTYYDSVHGDIRIANPLLYNNMIQRKSTVDRIVATGSATLDILDMVGHKNDNHKLDYNLNLSYSRSFVKGFTFLPAFILSNANYLAKTNERLSENYNNYSDFLVENYLTYDGKFGKHHLNAVAGFTFQREKYHTLAGWGNNFPEPYYLQVSNAATRDASSFESEHVLASIIGRINYDYDGKYLFQATVRRDGSSRLSVNRWDWFPSFSLGWRIDKERFFADNVDPHLVSLLKIRASYGILGNENIGDYAFMETMARGNYTYSFGGSKVTGSAISNYVNEYIRWEKKKSLDIGLDYSMFGGAFEFNADYYRNVSEDLLYSVPVPAEAGATNDAVTMNAATMVNSGVELSASYHNYKNAFKYDISGNITFPKNVVTSLGMGTVSRDDAMCRTVVGEEVGRFYGYVYEGIFQNQYEIDHHVNDNGNFVVQNGAKPGDVAYRDINNDGQITADDRTFLGSGMPKVQFGLSARFEYKGFDLTIATFGAAGHKLVDYVDQALHSSYGITNKSVDLVNAWTPTNTNTNVPRVANTAAGTVNNDFFSSRFLQNGAYWKIANVELGYNFPEKWFENAFIHGVRLYLSGQNLATITAYKGYNIDFAGGVFTPGFNYCSYPAPMSFMLGVNLSF